MPFTITMLLDCDAIADAFTKESLSIKEIAEKFNINTRNVKSILTYRGIDISHTNPVNKIPKLYDKPYLQSCIAHGLSLTDIAKTLNCHPNTIRKALQRNDISY